MRSIILAGMCVLSASASWAQTTTPPQPSTPAVEAQTDQAAPKQGGPANLCQELLAFMKAPPPEAPAPAGAAKPAEPPAQQSASAGQAAPGKESAATQGTTGAGQAKSDEGSGSAQQVTGQDGVATDAPEPGKDNAASGSVSNAPQKDSLSAPVPPADVTSTPKEEVLTVEAAEQLASANDVEQCQKTAREMRVAGVAMPPPLMALAALDLQYQQTSRPATEPTGTADPADDE
jgi:hypothetical protein